VDMMGGTKGTRPKGARSEPEAASLVRAMFGRIAHRYDLANHLLSFNIDRWWRARAVNRARPILERRDARVLDICCGTGDLVLALEKRRRGPSRADQRGCPVLGADFCHPMLVAAQQKIIRRRAHAALFESDALRLPLRDQSLDLLTVAFGFRNLANYAGGLSEIHRVLRPGGMAAILEFSQPPNPVFAALYNFYSRRILPPVGGFLTGWRDAYTYLPESVRKFPPAPRLQEDMRCAGFGEVRYEYLTGGIVALHTGVKK
jgi:demethylmenaquinone methyltransferase/2-methoxy-6-polyprenyl-1,4-benzoquinol methylase